MFLGPVVRQHIKVGAHVRAKPLPLCQEAEREEGEGTKAFQCSFGVCLSDLTLSHQASPLKVSSSVFH